jgi:hypothetical protein
MTYTKIFRCKSIQNSPKLGILVRKWAIWQPWLPARDQLTNEVSWQTGLGGCDGAEFQVWCCGGGLAGSVRMLEPIWWNRFGRNLRT